MSIDTKADYMHLILRTTNAWVDTCLDNLYTSKLRYENGTIVEGSLSLQVELFLSGLYLLYVGNYKGKIKQYHQNISLLCEFYF